MKFNLVIFVFAFPCSVRAADLRGSWDQVGPRRQDEQLGTTHATRLHHRGGQAKMLNHNKAVVPDDAQKTPRNQRTRKVAPVPVPEIPVGLVHSSHSGESGLTRSRAGQEQGSPFVESVHEGIRQRDDVTTARTEFCDACSLNDFPYPCTDLRLMKEDKTWDHIGAFDKTIDRLNEVYPFTEHKAIDWEALRDELRPQVVAAAWEKDRSEQKAKFIVAMKRLVSRMRDQNVNLEAAAACDDGRGNKYVEADPKSGPDFGKMHNSYHLLEDVKYQRLGGGFGFTLAPLDDGSVVVTAVVENSPAADAWVTVGDKVFTIDGVSVKDKAESLEWLNYDGRNPATAEHLLAYQYRMVVRAPVGTKTSWGFGKGTQELEAVDDDYATLELTESKRTNYLSDEKNPNFHNMPFSVVKLHELESGGKKFGYLPLTTENWKIAHIKAALQKLHEKKLRGLLIDVRGNKGGNDNNAKDLAGFFNPSTKPKNQFYEYVYGKNLVTKEWCENSAAMQVPKIKQWLAGNTSACQDAIKKPEKWEAIDMLQSRVYNSDLKHDWYGPIVVLVNGETERAGEGVAMVVNRLPKARAAVVGFEGTGASFGLPGGKIWLPEYLRLDFTVGQSRNMKREIQIDSGADDEGGISPTDRIPRTKENMIGFVGAPQVVTMETVRSGKDVEVNYGLKILTEIVGHDEKRAKGFAGRARAGLGAAIASALGWALL